MKQIHPNLQLNPTHESNNHINFLDLLIIRNPSNLEIDIHRKTTTTNTTINFLSNHPTEHNIAAYQYHITRMYSLPLTMERQQTEWKTMQAIAQNNNFPRKLTTNLKIQKQHKKIHQKRDKDENKTKKWAIFTYHSPKIRKLSNLFKHTNICIAFNNINTIQQCM